MAAVCSTRCANVVVNEVAIRLAAIKRRTLRFMMNFLSLVMIISVCRHRDKFGSLALIADFVSILLCGRLRGGDDQRHESLRRALRERESVTR